MIVFCARGTGGIGWSGVVVSSALPAVCILGTTVVSAAVAFACVCLSQVSGWLRSVDVFAVVPLEVCCFPSCRVGGYLARENVGAQASCFDAAFGSTPRAHGSSSGDREPVAWVQMQLTENRDVLVFSKWERAPLSAAVMCLDRFDSTGSW